VVGSVLFRFLSSVDDFSIKGKVYAYDMNDTLISMYKFIQNQHDELYSEVIKIVDTYKNCDGEDKNRNPLTIDEAKKSKENYYYWIRKKFNEINDKTTLKSCALFVFLNKTCFRGLYRCGPNGFNVAYGHYTNPEIINKQHLTKIHF